MCLSYAGVSYGQPSTLTLLRFDTMATPPAWAPATGQINTQSSTTICGSVAGLGSFIIVEDNTTTLGLSSSANPSSYGQSVTLTATITPGTATGSVTFSDGTSSLGTAAVANGTASVTTTQLSAGAHTIQAVYSDPQSFFSGSTGQLTQTVNASASTTTLSTSANPSVYGQAVTFTATVAGTGGTPTGSVNFLDGGVVLGSATLNSGVAVYSAALQGGTHSITAVYAGDTNFSGSTSAGVSETVNPAASAVS